MKSKNFTCRGIEAQRGQKEKEELKEVGGGMVTGVCVWGGVRVLACICM